MQETRHTSTQARWLYGTPHGILEFRAIPTATTTIETLIVHTPACNGNQCADLGYECDAESAGDISLHWTAGDDTGIWYGLAERATAREAATIVQPPAEATHEQRAFRGRLIAEGHRAATDPHYFN